MSFGSNPAGATTSTQNAEPWGPTKGPLQDVINQAGQLYGQGGPQVFPGQMVASPAPETLQAQGMQADRARSGNPIVSGAQGYTSDVLSGNYLNANPWLDAQYNAAARPMVNQFREATAPGIIGHAIQVGRHGSGAEGTQMGQAADILGMNLAGLGASIYGNNYAQERGYQQQAAANAPGLAAADYQDIGALNDVGQQRQAQSQAEIGANMQQFSATQNRPYDALQRYLSTLTGGFNQPQQQVTQPYFTNPAASAAGGAMAGGSLFGPWGALLGGAAGYLGSK